MDLRTVEKDRQKRRHDFLASKVSGNVRHVAEMMAKYYHMKGVPCCVVEDATTVLLRLDCYLKTNPITGEEEVWVQGFTSPLKVEKFTDLEDYFRDNKHDAVARYVYVWSLVPQLPNSPYWPIFMVASNNKFTARWVYEWWEYIVQEAVLCEISLIGFNHDGDSRCRKGDSQLNLHSVCNRMHILGSDGQPHPFMYLSIGELHGVHLLGGQDFFHVQMRVRRHLLDFKRKLALGRLGLARADHLSNCPFLYRDDLLHSNKQHWDGVVRMFSDKTVNWAKERAEKDARIKPTYSFLYFGSRLLRMVNGDCDQPASGISPTKMSVLRRQAVADAAFCMVFLLLWRYWLSKLANTEDLPDGIEKPYSVKDNFMTRETFLDIILLCQCRILLVKLYREKFPKFRTFGDRFSSRFAEYVFQYARMMETNAPLFGVLGFM
jgi:hypothetical protein